MSALSASDLLTESVAKTNAVKTVRIDIKQLTEERGEVSERLTTNIRQVGDDLYASRSSELSVDGEWQILPNRSSERLLYQGKMYSRSASGRWELELFGEGPGVAGYLIERGATETLPRSVSYGLDFGDLNDVENLGNETLEGEPVVHLRGRLRRQTVTPFKELASVIQSLPAGDQIQEYLQAISVPVSHDIWIGADDQLLKKFVTIEEYQRKEQVERRVRTIVRLSGFDEDLEIPGPLPER